MLVDETPLDPQSLALHAQEAAAAFMAAGTAANTVRSYRSALAYWSAWLRLRYGQALGDVPLPAPVAIQFVLDHLARPLADGGWAHLLPSGIDAALIATRIKARLGPLASNTVSHRLAELGKWHRINQWDSPTEAPALKSLLREAHKVQARQGVNVRKKTATKTDTGGVRREEPLRGPAAQALAAWLEVAPTDSGPLFRRLYKGGKVGTSGLSTDQVARIVQRRAKVAGLVGDWAAHSLRSGFVTEAGRQGVPLGEVMAMTEHRSVATVMGYFQSGSLLTSHATTLLTSTEISPIDSDESVNSDSDPE